MWRCTVVGHLKPSDMTQINFVHWNVPCHKKGQPALILKNKKIWELIVEDIRFTYLKHLSGLLSSKRRNGKKFYFHRSFTFDKTKGNNWSWRQILEINFIWTLGLPLIWGKFYCWGNFILVDLAKLIKSAPSARFLVQLFCWYYFLKSRSLH